MAANIENSLWICSEDEMAAIRDNFVTATSQAARLAADLDGNPLSERDKAAIALPKGWIALPVGNHTRLVRADMQTIMGTADHRLWAKQIRDFEFSESTQWSPEQIAEMRKRPWLPAAAESPVPFISGGRYDPKDSERYGCHLIWWPDELKVPFFEGEQGSRTLHVNCPTSGAPTYYDIGFDERRPVTQEIVDNLERGIQRLVAERQAAQSQCDSHITMLRQALAAKDARIAELKSVLASTPVAFEDPDAKPAPAPGFLTAIRQGNKAIVGFSTKPGDMPRSNE